MPSGTASASSRRSAEIPIASNCCKTGAGHHARHRFFLSILLPLHLPQEQQHGGSQGRGGVGQHPPQVGHDAGPIAGQSRPVQLLAYLLGMVRQQLKIAVSWLRVFLAPLLAGILMALVCLLCSQVILKNAASPVRMLVSAVVGLLVYFVSTVVLKGATRRELRCFAAGDVLIELASTMRLL